MHKVGCEGIVTAWEFCYRLINDTPAESATFYPSIWIPSEINGTLHYTLIQSSCVTFTPGQVDSTTENILCPRVNLSTIDQFTAPAGSVVGLYSHSRRGELELLHNIRGQSSITTYRFHGNHSNIQVANDSDISYNIALRVHLGMPIYTYVCVPVIVIIIIS